jgi:WhiB family transcriptional regulator, redox-sensing transcriptional regulator
VSWYEAAACKGRPTALFFPSDGRVSPVAAALCALCPVRDECAEAGRGEFGVWGGLGDHDRDALRRADGQIRMPRRVAACGTEPGVRRHRNNGEDPCEDCRRAAARAAMDRKRRRRVS